MISSFTSFLLVFTSNICVAFQQKTQHQRPSMIHLSPTIPRGIFGYNGKIVNSKEVDTSRRFRAATTSSAAAFRGNAVSPLAFPMMTPSEHPATNRRRNIRRRYMIGDAFVSTRSGGNSDCRPSELYCSAINPSDSALDDVQMQNNGVLSTSRSWKDNLLQFSTIASILCVIDCTLLPILTIILPLLGMVSAVNTILPFNHLVHHYGHLMTLYFVLPIGFFATTTNFLYNHRKKWITAIGWCGLLLILTANTGTGGCGAAVQHVHTHAHHTHHVARTVATSASLSLWDGWTQFASLFLDTIQHGIYHRITNLSGCFLLIASNYISHQYQKNHRVTHVHGKDCCAPSIQP